MFDVQALRILHRCEQFQSTVNVVAITPEFVDNRALSREESFAFRDVSLGFGEVFFQDVALAPVQSDIASAPIITARGYPPSDDYQIASGLM